MARPFVLPSEEDSQEVQEGQQLEQLMLALYMALQQVLRSRSVQHSSRNHRIPRRQGGAPGSRELVLVDSDLAGLPLPDLISSAMQQLPPPTPQVTVSAPSSPTRDAAFQFPESTGAANINNESLAANENANGNSEENNGDDGPVPSPRPRPRRRRFMSERLSKKAPMIESTCNGGSTCCGHPGQALQHGQWISVGANLRNIADDFHASKTKNAELEKSRLPLVGSGFPSNVNANSSSTDGILSVLIPAPLRETLWMTVALYLGWRLVSRLR